MYAEMFGIPWEILLGLINSEVGLDTKFYDAAVNWLSSNYPELMALWPDPGPGIGNVHLSTASVVLKYMYDTYGDDLSLFYESAGKAGQIHFLANTEANTVVIAAYTRMLADYRFGSQTSHANLQDWELEDAVAVWHGYRYGVPKVSPAGQGFTSQEAFQTRHVGLAVLISEVVTGKGPEHGPGSPEESAGKGSNYLRTAWNPYYGIRQ